jgi:hypothetical protein
MSKKADKPSKPQSPSLPKQYFNSSLIEENNLKINEMQTQIEKLKKKNSELSEELMNKKHEFVSYIIN